jgi:hypothetical protein
VAVTVAVSVTELPVNDGSTRAERWKLVDAPAATVPTAQVTVCPFAPQPASTDTKTSPEPRVSVSVTPVAADGPALLTTMVYDTGSPGRAAVVPVFVTDRSACGAVAVVAAVVELLAELGSAVVALTAAALMSTVPDARPAAAVAVTVNWRLAPAVRAPMAHVSGEPEQPVAAAPTMPEPGVSVRVTPAALEGPLFVTVTV